MKKYIIVFLLFFVAINVKAKEPNVRIRMVVGDKPVQCVMKFKILYGEKQIDDKTYETNNNGEFEGYINLEKNSYRIEIIDAPTNILLDENVIKVKDGKVDEKVYFYNVTGAIAIRRIGTIELKDDEYYIEQVSEFEIRAAEDIDDHLGTKFKKDDLVTTVKTPHGYGHAKLPLGKYYIEEKKIDDFIKDENIYTYNLTLDKKRHKHLVNTKHIPLKIESKEDFMLCVAEDILNDSNQDILMKKGECFEKKESYNIPYGKYIVKTKDEEKIIDFNQNNLKINIEDDNIENNNVENSDVENDNIENNNEKDNEMAENNNIENNNEKDNEKVENNNIENNNEKDNEKVENNNIENNNEKDNERVENNNIESNNEKDNEGIENKNVDEIKNDSLVYIEPNDSDMEMPKTYGRKNKNFLLINGIIFMSLGFIKRNYF